MTTYVSQSIEGVNFSGIYTPYDQTAAISTTNDPSSGGPPFKAGTTAVATDGSQWMFVKALGGINQYDVVMVTVQANAFTAVQILGGAAAEASDKMVAFYQNATAAVSGNYVWVMTSGAPTINVLASAVKNVQLYTTDTSGKLDDAIATGSQYAVRGVHLVTTNGASASSGVAVAQYPSIDPMGALF